MELGEVEPRNNSSRCNSCRQRFSHWWHQLNIITVSPNQYTLCYFSCQTQWRRCNQQINLQLGLGSIQRLAPRRQSNHLTQRNKSVQQAAMHPYPEARDSTVREDGDLNVRIRRWRCQVLCLEIVACVWFERLSWKYCLPLRPTLLLILER